MSSTGGGIVAHAQRTTQVQRNGKTLNIQNNRADDMSFDEPTICALVTALGSADGAATMTVD